MSPHRRPEPRGDERRAHPRASVDWPVTIALSDGDHHARLRDVSKAGVCFYLDRRLPEMTMLRLELEVPGAAIEDGRSRISGSGVVVRCRPLAPSLEHYEVAVFLNDMAEEDRDRLALFVRDAEAASA